jgi:hypothetical protein
MAEKFISCIIVFPSLIIILYSILPTAIPWPIILPIIKPPISGMVKPDPG